MILLVLSPGSLPEPRRLCPRNRHPQGNRGTVALNTVGLNNPLPQISPKIEGVPTSALTVASTGFMDSETTFWLQLRLPEAGAECFSGREYFAARAVTRVIITEYKLSVSTTKSSVAEGGQKSPAGNFFWLALR